MTPRPRRRESQPASKRPAANKKVANGLMALSSAVVLTVYTAGYMRTRAAAHRFTEAPAMRRDAAPPGPVATRTALPTLQPIAPDVSAKSRPAGSDVVVKPSGPKDSTNKPRPQRRAAETKAALPSSATAAAKTPDAPPPTPVSTAAPPAPIPAVPVAEVRAPEPPPPALAPPAHPQLKDGTYSGWGTSRHGDIQATVVVESGRIASAVISQCLTRYSCSWIAALPPQVVARQSAEVDYVSGATQSTNAFYYAVVEALTKAK